MLVALLLVSYRCIVTINVLWLFLTEQWVGLQYMIVVFPDHTHFLYGLRVDPDQLVLPEPAHLNFHNL